MWNSLPIDIRNSESLVVFKAKIKTWKPDTAHVSYVRNI